MPDHVAAADIVVGKAYRWDNQEPDDNHLEATIRVTEIGTKIAGEILFVHSCGYQIAQGGYNPGDVITGEIRPEHLTPEWSLAEAQDMGEQMAAKQIVFVDRYPAPAVAYASAKLAGKSVQDAQVAALEAGALMS